MARNIRIVDSPGYSRGGVTRPDVEVVETDVGGPYRRRRTGRGPLVFILIFALAAIWVYQSNGGEILGSQFGVRIPSVRNAPPVEIETAPVVPPVAPIETAPVVPPVAPVEDLPTVTTVEDTPTVSIEPRVITAERQLEVIGHSRVGVDRLNLRARPGFDRRVIAILPMDREVAILRPLHITPNGDEWVKVMADTDQGWLEGWVMRRHLESCNCPL